MCFQPYLFVDIELTEDLGSIEEMLVVEDLLSVECEQWQVQY